MSEAAKLTRGSISGHLVGQTTPMIIGVAAMMSVGLIDAYFIGQLGSAELAAMSFVFPIVTALASLGVGVMVGINSVVARALGEGDMERAQRKASFGIAFAFATGAVLGLLLLALVTPLFRLMQASDELLPLIRAYMVPFALGFPLVLINMGVNGVMRGQGEAKRTSVISITYAAANWVLDPILITGAFGFEGFGIAGAAYATLISWGIAVALGLSFNLANVIVLPLLFGLGVASSIHLVTRRRQMRAGGASVVETATPRAVLFSALTTIASFGSLAISPHRGMSSMGELLTVAIIAVLLATLVVLPCLMAELDARRAGKSDNSTGR